MRLPKLVIRISLLRHHMYGDMAPRFYGFAWQSMCTGQYVSMPIPLNLVARWARAFWFWLKRGGRELPEDPGECYERGVRDGRELAQYEYRMRDLM